MQERFHGLNSISKNMLYQDDINAVINSGCPFEKLRGKSILITGITGLIGTFLTHVIMRLNEAEGLRCKIYGVARNIQRAKELYDDIWEDKYFHFFEHDVIRPFTCMDITHLDYALHLASNTHPLQYSMQPISTITTNVIGTMNLLEFVRRFPSCRFLLASSNEIYGINRGDVERFDELYCGYIDSNTLRAGYPESKRCAESLCQAYMEEKRLDIVIARLTRTYGPTVRSDDTKVINQFILQALRNKDIVLKSSGEQMFSYVYVADAVSGLLYVLLKGETGEAYNIAYKESDIRLKDLASLIADYAGTAVVFEMPEEIEKRGYSLATTALLDGLKLQGIGWTPKYGIQTGVKRTMDILREGV